MKWNGVKYKLGKKALQCLNIHELNEKLAAKPNLFKILLPQSTEKPTFAFPSRVQDKWTKYRTSETRM
jgi:hypothetical protein